MASTKFYLDTRNKKPGSPCPLKIAIFTAKQTAFINLGLKLKTTEWDLKNNRVQRHPQKEALNALITEKLQQITLLIHEYTKAASVEYTAKELKQMIEERLNPKKEEVPAVPRNVFVPYMEKFMERYKSRTHDLYKCTLKKVKAFMESRHEKDLTFEDMNKDWLYQFDEYLAKTSPSQNARNIHFRNIRAVFNDAIDEEVTHAYPFRKFKIKPVRTKKRSFKVEVLRKIFDTPLKGHEEKYRDLFKLIFCLCGINVIDLCNLKAVEDGRIEYD